MIKSLSLKSKLLGFLLIGDGSLESQGMGVGGGTSLTPYATS